MREGDGVAYTYSTLGNADFGKQADVFKLAQMGDSKCESLWKQFSSEQPDQARLVITFVGDQNRSRMRANSIADGVLVKSKKKKLPKWVQKSENLTKRQKQILADMEPEMILRERIRQAWAESDDPWMRETFQDHG